MALGDWYINNDNIDGTIVTQTTYDGTHCLNFGPGISGNNYNGRYIFYPVITGGSIVDEGLISWSMENTITDSKFGAVIRSNSVDLVGEGYFVAIDTSFLPQSRGIEIHKGAMLNSSINTLQAATCISGGISGSWYEYQIDFYLDSSNLNIDVYTNESTRDDPSWVSQLTWVDTTPLISAGYTGFLCKNENQNYIQRVAGTGTLGFSDDNIGLNAQFDTPVCMAYYAELDQYIIADYGNASIRHMNARYPYAVTTGIGYGGIFNLRSMCVLAGYAWIKCSDAIYKYDPNTLSVEATISITGDNTDGDICTDGIDLYMTNGSHDGRIFKMVASDPYTITTIAGHTVSGGYADIDGTGTAAAMRQPFGITYHDGNFYFISRYNGYLRKMTSSYVVTTLAGGAGISNDTLAYISDGYFYGPIGVTAISDYKLLIGGIGKQLKLYDLNTTMVSTISGDGNNTNTDQIGLSGSFGIPFYSKGLNSSDSCVYFPSYDGNTIWKHPINFKSEVVFGSGYPASDAVLQITADTGRNAVIFNSWRGMRYYNGYLYYMDNIDSTLLRINPKTWVSTVIAGSPGTSGHTDANGTSARFNQPQGMSIYNGIIYIAEYQYLRTYNISTGAVATLITRSGLTCISVLVTGTYIYTGWRDASIQRTDMNGGSITKVVGNSTGDIVDHATGTSASVFWPNFSNESWDSTSNVLYFADSCSIRTVELTGTFPVDTIAGPESLDVNGYVNATGTTARFAWPEDLILDNNKENLLVLDTYNNRMRKVQLSDNSVTTYVGQGLNPNYDTEYQVSVGWRENTYLYLPQALTIAGNNLYVSVYGNILRIMMNDVGLDINVDFLKIKKYLD